MTRLDLSLDDFAGTWDVHRRIDDRLAGQEGRFVGRARITPEDGHHLYAETGTLVAGPGPGFEASRRYLWRAGEGSIAVFFEDGRPFHLIDLAGPRPEARHDCPPDLYLGRYDFTDWPRWSVTWRVRGPRKDYRMTTRLSPATL